MFKTCILFVGYIAVFVSCTGVRERSVIAYGKIQSICVAESKYFQEEGKYGTLSDLRQQNLISNDIVNGQYNGYNYEVNFTPFGYVAIATPVGYGTKEAQGIYVYYVDESNKIKIRFPPKEVSGEVEEAIHSSCKE